MNTSWMDRAACKSEPTGAFFPEHGQADYSLARRTCAACPVAHECLAYALTKKISHGMFGGFTPHQRHLLRRLLRQEAA